MLDHLQTPEGAARDLSSVRATDTGTSATPPELLDALRATFPAARVRVFYGSTEAGGVAALEHDDLDRKPGRCGLPSPFVPEPSGLTLLAIGAVSFVGPRLARRWRRRAE